MKRKEYYAIGRLIGILGYVFFAVDAFVSPALVRDGLERFERESGSWSFMIGLWQILIPLGFWIMALSFGKWLNYFSAILTTLGAGMYFLLIGASAYGISKEENKALNVFAYFLEWIQEKGLKTVCFSIVVVVLLLAMVVTAIIRLIAVRRWKPFCIPYVVVLSTVWALFSALLTGLFLEDADSFRFYNWLDKLLQSYHLTRESFLSAIAVAYRVMIVMSTVAFGVETAAEFGTRKA